MDWRTRDKYKSSKQKQKQKMIIECLPACLPTKERKGKPRAQATSSRGRML
jgi:hypothetical protein